MFILQHFIKNFNQSNLQITIILNFHNMRKCLNFTLWNIRNNLFFFCAQKKRFMKSQAILASRIMNEITHERSMIQLGKQLEKESLHDKILRLVAESSFQKQAKEGISNIFSRGVVINQMIWSTQQRVQDGKIETQNYYKSQSDLYSFCPTYMITGRIFRHILKSSYNRKKNLLTGYFGISKTFSFLLYSILSDKIIQYKLSTKPRENQMEINGQKIINAPKMIYLSYEPDQKFVQNLQNKIKAQCKEIFKSEDLSFSLQDVKKEYAKRKIKINLTIDQINKIASAFRVQSQAQKIRTQIKEKYQHSSYEQQREIIKQQIKDRLNATEEQISKSYQLGRKTMNFINKNRSLFDSIIFLSSVNIQKSVSHDLNLGGEAGHTNIETLSINYPQLYQEQQFKKQIVDYFLFQQHQRFLTNLKQFQKFYYSLDHKDIELKQKIRHTLFNKLVENPYFFTTPFFIRACLVQQWRDYSQQSKRLNPKTQNIEDLSLHNFLQNHKLSEQMLREKVEEFLTTKNFNDDQRDHLIIELYYQARKVLKQSPEQNYAKINLYCDSDAWYRIRQKADKHLFKFDNNDRSFTCLLPADVIVNLLGSFVNAKLKQITKSPFFSRFINEFSQSIKGQILQDMFIAQITNGSPSLTILKNNKTFPDGQAIKIASQIYGFTPIPKKKKNQKTIENKNYSFLKSLLPSFESIMKNNQIGSRVFLPTKLKQQSIFPIQNEKFNRNLINGNSKRIDLIIANINNKFSAVTIDAFDVFMHNKQKLDMSKLYDFISDYIYFKDFDQTQTVLNGEKYKIYLNYYVLAPNLESIDWSENTHLSALKQQSDGKLEFNKETENAQIWKVRGLNQSKVLLDQIGFIDIKNDVTISDTKALFEKTIFDKICQSKKKK